MKTTIRRAHALPKHHRHRSYYAQSMWRREIVRTQIAPQAADRWSNDPVSASLIHRCRIFGEVIEGGDWSRRHGSGHRSLVGISHLRLPVGFFP